MVARTKNPVRRVALKQERLAARLREKIVSGILKPGDRLPNRDELVRDTGLSPITVQAAIDRLVADGFLRARTGQGTFVADQPPHLSSIAIAFPTHPGDHYLSPWSKFCKALDRAISTYARRAQRKVKTLYDVNGHEDSESQQMLVQDIRAQRLAGVIFAEPPFGLVRHPIVEVPDLPRVGFMHENRQFPTIKAVRHDFEGLVTRAMQYFASRGRKRIAFLNASSWDPGHEALTLKAAAEAGMTTRPYWSQAVHPFYPQWARRAVHLIMHDGQHERPDALFVLDDHLALEAQYGLMDAGVVVGDAIDVIAHANFPIDYPDPLPVVRLGFYAPASLQTCIDLIDRMRRQEEVPDITILPAVFQHELPAETHGRRTHQDALMGLGR
jgi:DNA-binding LacI/PurR family transcriptional regulator